MIEVEHEPRQLLVGAALMLVTAAIQTFGVVLLQESIDLRGQPTGDDETMKVQAMKNDPDRRLQDLADVGFLMSVPGVNEDEVRGYFERAGLLKDFDELRRTH
ncbi:MAG TPA: hypothetical protein VMR54_15770 [Thermoanaerobaculia bacterium]|nr:hypothetical protein [Thermoanaerobaculia bacterium]